MKVINLKFEVYDYELYNVLINEVERAAALLIIFVRHFTKYLFKAVINNPVNTRVDYRTNYIQQQQQCDLQMYDFMTF